MRVRDPATLVWRFVIVTFLCVTVREVVHWVCLLDALCSGNGRDMLTVSLARHVRHFFSERSIQVRIGLTETLARALDGACIHSSSAEFLHSLRDGYGRRRGQVDERCELGCE